MAREWSLVVQPEGAGQRLDLFLARAGEVDQSRSHLQRLIEDGGVTVNGAAVRSSYRTRAGDVIRLVLPEPRPAEPVPEDIPLDVVYEDADLIVINKPRGLVVHPAPGNPRGTLVNALLAHCRDLPGINDTLRPGIVHRLDKDTTGLMVAAKSEQAQRGLIDQIKARNVRREYLALVHGVMAADSGVIDAPIARHPLERKKMSVQPRRGRKAITHFQVEERFREHTLVGARLETGRTHQVRVHFAYIGHPVVGDPVYAGRRPRLGLGGQALHARTLGFLHPVLGEYMEFHAPPPPDMQAVIDRLHRGED